MTIARQIMVKRWIKSNSKFIQYIILYWMNLRLFWIRFEVYYILYQNFFLFTIELNIHLVCLSCGMLLFYLIDWTISLKKLNSNSKANLKWFDARLKTAGRISIKSKRRECERERKRSFVGWFDRILNAFCLFSIIIIFLFSSCQTNENRRV